MKQLRITSIDFEAKTVTLSESDEPEYYEVISPGSEAFSDNLTLPDGSELRPGVSASGTWEEFQNGTVYNRIKKES